MKIRQLTSILVISLGAASGAGPLDASPEVLPPGPRRAPLSRHEMVESPHFLASPSIEVAQVFAEPLATATVELPWEAREVESLAAAEARARLGEADPAWMPPDWFPEEEREALLALEGMHAGPETQGPDLRLRSRAAFVYDLDAGEVLLAQAADERRPVASLTKLVSALTLVREGAPLDEELCLDQSHVPSWPGAVSRLPKGACSTGWDLLGAALVRSDNGAALSFASLAGLPLVAFVDGMDRVAQDLGMDQSSFADPTGIFDENLSTARDMTRAVVAAAAHPELAPALDAPYWLVEDRRSERTRRFLSTNRLLRRGKVDVVAAKTGYTDTARHCFTAVVRDRRGHRIAMTVMGARWSSWRWRDVSRILRWVERRR